MTSNMYYKALLKLKKNGLKSRIFCAKMIAIKYDEKCERIKRIGSHLAIVVDASITVDW